MSRPTVGQTSLYAGSRCPSRPPRSVSYRASLVFWLVFTSGAWKREGWPRRDRFLPCCTYCADVRITASVVDWLRREATSCQHPPSVPPDAAAVPQKLAMSSALLSANMLLLFRHLCLPPMHRSATTRVASGDGAVNNRATPRQPYHVLFPSISTSCLFTRPPCGSAPRGSGTDQVSRVWRWTGKVPAPSIHLTFEKEGPRADRSSNMDIEEGGRNGSWHQAGNSRGNWRRVDGNGTGASCIQIYQL